MTKFIFVTGGVVSGLGKGITAASLGRLLKCRGLKVTSQKLDPYMNVDPGTMSPFQHGEVFVTDDGAETDLDLGHYERFIDENLSKYSNLTSGRVYWNVLNKERQGEYLGQTVQIIPHVTNEIKDFILKNAEVEDADGKKADVSIVEIGGTIGDIESQPFLEAIRQLAIEVGRKNCLFIHVCLVPYISGSDEFKSKPTQHSVKEIMAVGIHPDIIVTRSDGQVPEEIRKKISLFCNVSEDCVIDNRTLGSLYEVPLMLHEQKMDEVVCRELGINSTKCDISHWQKMVDTIHARKGEVVIALVGKYVKLHDSYLSIVESLNHASFVIGKNVKIKWVDSDSVTDETAPEVFADCSGIILPGGFGHRGIEGMVCACRYARTHKLPYFGICLGMQIAVIEFARSVLGYKDANSREFDELCEHPVIDLMKNQEGVIKGGTMRLGSYPCTVTPGTILEKAYGKTHIDERHRHRYEFNNDYREEMTKAGLTLSGTSPDGTLVEAVEVKDQFHVGVQFHPEFKSRPNNAGPLFVEFLRACSK
ncbi:MAG: CTP synthase [Treponema sp.]|uniref:CTP synthase n=1 Tax=Treponema sp. TaxID=166 RepID=UPI00298E68B3|nr:CTP synthase [Treponema sp.]MBR5933580.1 CTP synthase [Treponema sp.]